MDDEEQRQVNARRTRKQKRMEEISDEESEDRQQQRKKKQAARSDIVPQSKAGPKIFIGKLSTSKEYKYKVRDAVFSLFLQRCA